MNKDLYIALLEDRVDDLTTAAKIDTVLSLRKIDKIRGLKSDLASVQDWNKAQVWLISCIADTAMDYQEELNELKIKHTEETQELRAEYLKTLETIKERETRECNENVRLQSKIAELEKETAIEKELKREVAQLTKQNGELQKQLNEAVREIAKLNGDKLAKEENK